MTFLEQKIRDAHTAGRTALIPFVTAGFPTLDTFWGIIEELDANGADVIEIGVPFSDPVADGPVVEDASRRALEQGVSLNWIMDGLKQRAGNFKAGIVLMGYLNPFLQYGLERFAADAAQAGVSGCIVPDLPLDESAPVRTTLKAHGIDLIALVGQNTSEERMREYAAVSEGYVYVVSVLGTTGARTGLPQPIDLFFHDLQHDRGAHGTAAASGRDAAPGAESLQPAAGSGLRFAAPGPACRHSRRHPARRRRVRQRPLETSRQRQHRQGVP